MAMQSLRRGIRLLPSVMHAVAAEGAPAAWAAGARTSSTPAFSLARMHTTPSLFSLSSAVKKELHFEKEQAAEATETALQAVPQGWKLSTKPIDTLMRLTRTTDGEEVVVEVNTVEQEEAFQEGEEEEEVAYPINFSVLCIKGDQQLKFSCIYVENDTEPPSIQHVAIEPKGGYSQADMMKGKYEGPTYAELDDDLQAEFTAYLQARGINAEFGQYLCRLIFDKEQAEYVDWLGRLSKFVS